MTDQTLFIRNAEQLLADGSSTVQDVRIANKTIQAVGNLVPSAVDQILDAGGCLLVPGLHDHHMHLTSFAASLNSVQCGSPQVNSEDELAVCLNNHTDTGWLRGIGYHESVMPHLDKHWLDKYGPDRPIRIQHRSGRLWVFNSAGLDRIQALASSFDPQDQQRLHSADGRLFDVDELVSQLTRVEPPPMGQASRLLAAYGITGINDMTPSNDLQTWDWMAQLQSDNEILQKVRLSGRPELSGAQPVFDGWRLEIGETKFHLHETALPEFPTLVEGIARSHQAGRCVAIHCVTTVELVFSLSALREAGVKTGDRIEHASVVPADLVDQLLELGLGVVTQPNFVFERGDAYLRDVAAAERPYLYRVNSLVSAGVPVGFGTDSPFGHPDPWLAMKTAVDRQTLSGKQLGQEEGIAPLAALQKFLGTLADPFTLRTLVPGVPADLCLLDLPWKALCADFCCSHVRTTICDGEVIYARD